MSNVEYLSIYRPTRQNESKESGQIVRIRSDANKGIKKGKGTK